LRLKLTWGVCWPKWDGDRTIPKNIGNQNFMLAATFKQSKFKSHIKSGNIVGTITDGATGIDLIYLR
jgi:hypothetical protein